MQRNYFSLGLWLIAVIEISFYSCTRLKYSQSHRIVGGKTVELGGKPYYVSIEINSQSFCGGALIGPKAVLTAAHCSSKATDELKMLVRAGSVERGIHGQIYPVAEYKIHPDFDPDSFDSDVSILFLMFEIYNSPFMRPIKVIGYDVILPPGTVGEIVGMGKHSVKGQGAAEVWTTKVPIIDDITCKRIFGYEVTGNMFCAGFLSGGDDACLGDSGGPFVVNDYLYGLISWGVGCGEPNLPGVYTRLSKFSNWINKQLELS